MSYTNYNILMNVVNVNNYVAKLLTIHCNCAIILTVRSKCTFLNKVRMDLADRQSLGPSGLRDRDIRSISFGHWVFNLIPEFTPVGYFHL